MISTFVKLEYCPNDGVQKIRNTMHRLFDYVDSKCHFVFKKIVVVVLSKGLYQNIHNETTFKCKIHTRLLERMVGIDILLNWKPWHWKTHSTGAPKTKRSFLFWRQRYATSGILLSQIRLAWRAALPQLSGQKVTAWIFWVVSCCTVKNK